MRARCPQCQQAFRVAAKPAAAPAAPLPALDWAAQHKYDARVSYNSTNKKTISSPLNSIVEALQR